MSIILKGVDLPTEDQVFVIHSDGTFNLVDPTARVLMPLYQAIQVPKGHGRLIDIDALIDKSEPKNWNGVWMNDIIDAPTILEREGTNEDPDRFIIEAEAES